LKSYNVFGYLLYHGKHLFFPIVGQVNWARFINTIISLNRKEYKTISCRW
jgi:hypothetical protein